MKYVMHLIKLDLEEGFDAWVESCALDIVEGVEQRLAFEAWADERGS